MWRNINFRNTDYLDFDSRCNNWKMYFGYVASVGHSDIKSTVTIGGVSWHGVDVEACFTAGKKEETELNAKITWTVVTM